MNILHIIEDFSIKSGGLRTVVKDLDFHLNQKKNINSIILSSDKEPEDNIYLINNAKGKPWLYSQEWKVQLKTLVNDNDINIIHIHGVWMFPQYIAAKFALKNNIPYFLTPHGMYEPWLWSKGKLKKKLYFKYITKNLFSLANMLHAITTDELNNLKRIFPQSSFLELPNLIYFNDTQKERSVIDQNLQTNYILYLGRLHEKKGIELLIDSFYSLKSENVILKIAGSFNNYKFELEKRVDNLGISNKVQFLGQITGREKDELFKKAHVFVAPSYSEVVGMVNLEAAIQKTPVITTYQTGLKKEWNDNGGFLINPIEGELTEALKKALSWTKKERDINGDKLYNFVRQNYSWNSRLVDWINIYKNIINKE